MYKIIVNTDIDWDKEECIVTITDYEFEYTVNENYRVDMEILDKNGIEYLDNLFVYLINEASKKLIANRIECRKEIKNVYEDIINAKKAV